MSRVIDVANALHDCERDHPVVIKIDGEYREVLTVVKKAASAELILAERPRRSSALPVCDVVEER